MSDHSSDWQPTCSHHVRQLRAKLLADIRAFFAERKVLEVDTPLLSQHTVTDVHIDSFVTKDNQQRKYYLQTSPEYAMKRLLAANSGAIYQLSKAFRREDSGKNHNPEFTLLEWYRPNFDHHQLMDEVDLLLQKILHTDKATRSHYQQLFQQYLHIDPMTSTTADLQQLAAQAHFNEEDRDTLLDFLWSHHIEPNLGQPCPLFVYDFPASQAALAKINPHNPGVSERFEVFVNGIELANGFHELQNANEQLQRFKTQQQLRREKGLTAIDIDDRFINALEHGLPCCAGVALGIDRLLMLKAKASSLQAVINFPWEIA